jgi:putative ABC transport system permease protein
MLTGDLGFAFKRLRWRRASIIGLIGMLAMGIGLATTMFALTDPFLSRPLPYSGPDDLILIEIDTMKFGANVAGPHGEYPELDEWRERSDLFDGLAAFRHHDVVRVHLAERVVALQTIAVSSDFFRVLGIPAPAPVTSDSVSDEIWLTPHAASGVLAGSDLVGATLSVQPSGSLQVRAVLPPWFLVPEAHERTAVDALVELGSTRLATTDGARTDPLTLVGRLRPGVDPAIAGTALNAIAAPYRFGVTVTPLTRAMKAQRRPLAAGALAAGLLVLVVCAANTIGIALTRGLFRAHELATMEILGADRARIVRLILAEGALVVTTATFGALLVVVLLLKALVAVVPRNLIVLGSPQMSGRGATFMVIAGVAACMAWCIGSILAWRRGRTSLRVVASREGRMVRAVRFGLTAGQVAVTLVLLAAAVLLVRSYVDLVWQDTGLAGNTMALSVSYGPEATGERLRETIDRTIAELRRVPGRPLAAAVVGEMADDFTLTGMVMLDRVAPVELLWVSPGYFEAAGMTLAAGRALRADDAHSRAVVINQAFAARYLRGGATVGEQVRVSGRRSPIVGIVRNSRRKALDAAPEPAVFRLLDERVPGMHVTYLMKGGGDAIGLFENTILNVSPNVVVLDESTLRARLSRTVQDRSFAMLVVGLFAIATVVVTAAGITGVVAYGVARRTREIGIRMAIGATSTSVTWLTMRDVSVAVAAGMGLGLIAFVWVSDIVSSLVYDVSPRDWPTLASTAALLMGLTVATALVTARRAGRLSPTIALREE